MESRRGKDNLNGKMAHLIRGILKRISDMGKESSSPSREALRDNGKMMLFKVLGTWLLQAKAFAENGSTVATKSLILFSDIQYC